MTSIKPCIFTGATSEYQLNLELDLKVYESEACGVYALTDSALFHLRDYMNGEMSVTQGTINCARKTLEMHGQEHYVNPVWCTRGEENFLRDTYSTLKNPRHRISYFPLVIEDYLNEYVDHSTKPALLLEQVGKLLAKNKAFAPFYLGQEQMIRAGIVDIPELESIVQFLYQKRYIKDNEAPREKPANEPNEKFKKLFQMTVDGWSQLKASPFSSKKVFIATAFSWPEDDSVRIEAINAIERACKNLGYDAEVVSQNHTDNISNRILADIKKARFVIAELTYNNRGVYFEAGFARGLDKKVFHLVRKGFNSNKPEDDKEGRKIHFDIQQVMYRTWEYPEDLEILLQDWIEASIGKA